MFLLFSLFSGRQLSWACWLTFQVFRISLSQYLPNPLLLRLEECLESRYTPVENTPVQNMSSLYWRRSILVNCSLFCFFYYLFDFRGLDVFSAPANALLKILFSFRRSWNFFDKSPSVSLIILFCCGNSACFPYILSYSSQKLCTSCWLFIFSNSLLALIWRLAAMTWFKNCLEQSLVPKQFLNRQSLVLQSVISVNDAKYIYF